MFDRSGTTEELTVFRGTSGDFFDKLKLGDYFQDDGFVSTTVDKDVANRFLRHTYPPKAFLEIKMPKGTKAISLKGISEYPEEEEILINRGYKFKVTGIDKSGDKKTITVELIHEKE